MNSITKTLFSTDLKKAEIRPRQAFFCYHHKTVLQVYYLFCEGCYVSTMLQKLSKCEVKAWLCWNLIILLPPQFYVKSNFGVFKRSNNVIFGNFRIRTLNFGKFGTWKLLTVTKNQNSEPLKLLKWLFWTVWIRQNLISRKMIKFHQKHALTFESFRSIVHWCLSWIL